MAGVDGRLERCASRRTRESTVASGPPLRGRGPSGESARTGIASVVFDIRIGMGLQEHRHAPFTSAARCCHQGCRAEVVASIDEVGCIGTAIIEEVRDGGPVAEDARDVKRCCTAAIRRRRVRPRHAMPLCLLEQHAQAFRRAGGALGGEMPHPAGEPLGWQCAHPGQEAARLVAERQRRLVIRHPIGEKRAAGCTQDLGFELSCSPQLFRNRRASVPKSARESHPAGATPCALFSCANLIMVQAEGGVAASSEADARASPGPSDAIALQERTAAVEEAETLRCALDAKLSVMRSFLASRSAQFEEREVDVASMKTAAAELTSREVATKENIHNLKEGIGACEQRLALTKQLLHEGARKLEALRARGGVAEESHREKTIQLGVLGERLLERGQQVRALTLHCLEARLRIGLDAWLPTQRCAEALERWRAGAAERSAKREKMRGAALLWRAGALHGTLVSWQRGCARPTELEVLAQERRGA